MRLKVFDDFLRQEHHLNRDEIIADMYMIRQDAMAEVRETLRNENEAHIRRLIGDFGETEYTAYCIFNQHHRDETGFREKLMNMTVRYLLSQELGKRGLNAEEQSEAESDDQSDDD